MTSLPALYLTAYGYDTDGSLRVPLESGIVFFVTTYTNNTCLSTSFIQGQPDGHKSLTIPPSSLQGSPSLLTPGELPQIVQGCLQPAILFPDGRTIVAGLCSVVRWTLKFLLDREPDNSCLPLLGFRQGCLSACAESSVWTKFCEVELPQATRQLLQALEEPGEVAVSRELAKLEAHLGRPVKAHNILKRKQDLVKESTNGKSDVSQLVRMVEGTTLTEEGKSAGPRYVLDHCYMEGIDLTISDLIVFVCIHLCWTRLQPWLSQLQHHFPRLHRWHSHMLDLPLVHHTVAQLTWSPQPPCDISLTFPPVVPFTLYSKDKLEPKAKTRNLDPSPILAKLQSAGVDHREIPDVPPPPHSHQGVVWEKLPNPLTVSGGNLPAERLLRKQQQLSGVINALLQLRLRDGEVVVDFCSGGGHVGLILAHLLPRNLVVLVENKEASMAMARRRAQEASLNNLHFYQCNLDYFCGKFDVGLCLHGCGTATDLVLARCLSQSASYVCVPCCYGAVDSASMPYPRSHKYQHSAGLSAEEFEMLAHCADRTETGTAKQQEGMLCMRYVDCDRCLATTELQPDFHIYLSRLQPPSCSPKNHLLVGIAPRHLPDTN